MRLFYLTGMLCISFVIWCSSANSAERRCGWFENPTPANATLTDRDGTWEIATQGGYQAEGEWPRFGDTQWVRTGNGNYGYGCACVTADTDQPTHRMSNLTNATARSLRACRTDKTLKEPQNPLAELQQMVRYQGRGFSFDYPKGWTIKKEKQCLNINKPSRLKNEEYTLNICAEHDSLEQATDSMIFYKENGVWTREAGMDPPSPVDIIQGAGWKGMQTTQTCGISDEETGFHAAGGICFMAIVYNSQTQLLFDTVGFYQDFDVINAIVQSIKFSAK
ncbi:DUF4087 domain-containing protein [Rahnella woolbedingensis]|uniref:DUF4087 domain-containing protein n=1 Tax=Rahnella woolbedingensis TaxID=1510574 RepID=A0A419N379_9GAMM|nr:DUF4087 domain-containing protein [Rahnella woolbedingensis]RJT37360.1 DUF4087 domain-containing protein [Rahnella woolbedingensis]